MILSFLKQRGLLLALVLISAWAVSLKVAALGLQSRLERCQNGTAAIVAAMNESRALAEAAREDEERRTAANAERSDASHAEDLDRTSLAAGRYAAAHRITRGGLLATDDRGATNAAPTAAGGDGPGVHEGMSADPFVAVSSPDLQACTAAVTYAVAAHNWSATIRPPDP